MKRKQLLILILVVAVAGVSYYQYRKSRSPRTKAIQVAEQLNQALENRDSDALLELVSLPPAYDGRTDAEKVEFLTKALRNEVSEEGLRRLMREGTFGALLDVFPSKGKVWAEKAGVKADECVAFRMAENGMVSELVIFTGTTPHRIIRLNNIQ